MPEILEVYLSGVCVCVSIFQELRFDVTLPCQYPTVGFKTQYWITVTESNLKTSELRATQRQKRNIFEQKGIHPISSEPIIIQILHPIFSEQSGNQYCCVEKIIITPQATVS